MGEMTTKIRRAACPRTPEAVTGLFGMRNRPSTADHDRPHPCPHPPSPCETSARWQIRPSANLTQVLQGMATGTFSRCTGRSAPNFHCVMHWNC